MKLVLKLDWADANLSLILIQFRCQAVYSSMSSGDHRWPPVKLLATTARIIRGPPMAIAKAANATSVVHGWDIGGSSMTTGGLW